MIPLFVALAGGLGAASRFIVDGVLVARRRGNWPVATLIINVIGSGLLGLVLGLGLGNPGAVIGTGFLGGFTTFSTASVEVARLADEGRLRTAVGLATVMLAISLAAAALGLWMGSALH